MLPGGPTQDEVMAVSLIKLSLQPEDNFLDIGCGTGKVGIKVSPFVKDVIGIDKREEAITCALDAAKKAGVKNIKFVMADAIQYLKNSGPVDSAFVGGTQGLPEILSMLVKKNVRSLVINVVKLNSLSTAVNELQKSGFFHEVIQVNISRSYPIGDGIMFKPINPVFIIVGGRPQC